MEQESSSKIKSFTDLVAWQQAHKLSVMIYGVTKDFPHDEIFGLTSQIRRAIVSIESNIAEGFGRRTVPDKIHLYDMARASTHEMQTQSLLARDIGYLTTDSFKDISEQSITVHKLLTGLINKTKQNLDS